MSYLCLLEKEQVQLAENRDTREIERKNDGAKYIYKMACAGLSLACIS